MEIIHTAYKQNELRTLLGKNFDWVIFLSDFIKK